MAVVIFNDLVKLVPEKIVFSRDDPVPLQFEVLFDGEICTNVDWKIKLTGDDAIKQEWSMTQGRLILPNDLMWDYLQICPKLEFSLEAAGIGWELATSSLELDRLYRTTVFRQGILPLAEFDFHFDLNKGSEVDISIESFFVNEDWKIISNVEELAAVIDKSKLRISINLLKKPYIGSRIVIGGTGNSSATLLDYNGPLILLSQKSVPIEQYWGKGRSNITLFAYKLTDEGPEMMEKANVHKKYLRKMPARLESLQLKLVEANVNSFHHNQTSIISQLQLKFISSNANLESLYKNEFLSSINKDLFVKGSDLGSWKLNYSDNMLECKIKLNPDSIKKIRDEYFELTFDGKEIETGGLKSVFRNLKIPTPKIRLERLSEKTIRLLFLDGPLSTDLVFHVKGELFHSGSFELKDGFFCPECGVMLDPILAKRYNKCDKCNYDGSKNIQETIGYEISVDGNSAVMHLQKDFSKIILHWKQEQATKTSFLNFKKGGG